MRRNRGEFFRDLEAVGFLRAEDFELGFFLGVDELEAPGFDELEGVGGFGEEEVAGASGAWAATTLAAHTDAINTSAKKKNLRKCPTTSSNYRRKLLPRRETSSSARLRINS